MIHRTRTRNGRPGFSLAELLVVLAIIAILAGLTAVAVFRLIGSQSDKNTQTLLRKLHDTTGQQWSEASKQFRDQTQSNIPPYVLSTLAGGDLPRAQIIWLKLQLRREFPMSYAEITDPAGGNVNLQPYLQAIPSYQAALKNLDSTKTNSKGIYTESAACLLIALQKPRKGMKFNAEEALGPGAVQDTDGDGVPEIVDGWGNPVVMFRWGTGNTDLDAQAPSNVRGTLDRDVEDPFHTLMNSNWNSQTNNTNYANSVGVFETLCHRIEVGGTPRSFFTIPVIVSAGKDGKFGLNNDMSVQSTDANDNLYSFQVK